MAVSSRAKRMDGPTDDGRAQGSHVPWQEVCCACSYRIHPCRIVVIDEKTMRGQRGVEVHRAESLNGSPVFIRALADILVQHLKENDAGAPPTSVQMGLRCPGCLNVICVQQKSFFARTGNA
jgi:hypothetical protein